MFAALGWTEPHGAAALGLLALMVGELIITLWDFIADGSGAQPMSVDERSDLPLCGGGA